MPRFHAAKESFAIPVDEPMLGERDLDLVYLALRVQSEGEEPAQ